MKMWVYFFLELFLVSTLSKAEPLPLGTELGGVRTEYTDFVLKTATESQKAEENFQLRCFQNPKNDLYIGVEQRVRIHAALSAVDAVLSDFDHLKDLFPGYKDIHLVSKTENRFLTYWEQRVPLFFVPNVKYEMIYLVDRSMPTRVVYRYQLKESGTLKASDGFISIRKEDDTHTDFVEYDFFDAEWGAAQILGKTKIWSDAVEGLYLSDLATQLKAENENWSHQKAKNEAEKQLKRELIKNCVSHPQTLTIEKVKP